MSGQRRVQDWSKIVFVDLGSLHIVTVAVAMAAAAAVLVAGGGNGSGSGNGSSSGNGSGSGNDAHFIHPNTRSPAPWRPGILFLLVWRFLEEMRSQNPMCETV